MTDFPKEVQQADMEAGTDVIMLSRPAAMRAKPAIREEQDIVHRDFAVPTYM